MHILLVEDNPTNERVARMLLANMGHTILWVENGQVALETLAKGDEFDCILMDLAMPVLGGLDATRRIIEAYPEPKSRPPIIAVTANVFEQDRRACEDAGMVGFLPKPLRLDPLRVALENLGGPFSADSPDEANSQEIDIDEELFCSFVEVDDDESLEIFDEFCTEVPEQIENMEKSYQAAAAPEFADLAHQLKGTSSNFGLAGFSDRVGELEQAGMSGDLASIPGSWAQDLHQMFQNAEKSLRSLLKV